MPTSYNKTMFHNAVFYQRWYQRLGWLSRFRKEVHSMYMKLQKGTSIWNAPHTKWFHIWSSLPNIWNWRQHPNIWGRHPTSTPSLCIYLQRKCKTLLKNIFLNKVKPKTRNMQLKCRLFHFSMSFMTHALGSCSKMSSKYYHPIRHVLFTTKIYNNKTVMRYTLIVPLLLNKYIGINTANIRGNTFINF